MTTYHIRWNRILSENYTNSISLSHHYTSPPFFNQSNTLHALDLKPFGVRVYLSCSDYVLANSFQVLNFAFLNGERICCSNTSEMLSLEPSVIILKPLNRRINCQQQNYPAGMLVQKCLELYNTTAIRASLTLFVVRSASFFLYINGKECVCTISYQVA